MHIEIKKLERCGIRAVINKGYLSIHGTRDFPPEVEASIKTITDEMEFTPQECDNLVTYVADVTLWATLKRLNSE